MLIIEASSLIYYTYTTLRVAAQHPCWYIQVLWSTLPAIRRFIPTTRVSAVAPFFFFLLRCCVLLLFFSAMPRLASLLARRPLRYRCCPAYNTREKSVNKRGTLGVLPLLSLSLSLSLSLLDIIRVMGTVNASAATVCNTLHARSALLTLCARTKIHVISIAAKDRYVAHTTKENEKDRRGFNLDGFSR